MKVRSAYGALCAAVALTAGLVISAGTAHADTTCVPSIAGVTPVVTCPTVTDPVTTTPVPTTVPVTTPVPVPPWHHGGGNDIVCTTATSCTQNGLPYTGSVTACTTFPCRLDSNGNVDSDPSHGGFGGHFRPGFPGYPGYIGNGVLGIPGLNLVNGNSIQLVNGQLVDVCNVPSWQTFYGRYNHDFAGSWRSQLNELRYQQLLAQASCANNSGFNGLTLVNGQWIDLNSYGVVGGNTVNVCSYSNYDQFNQFGVRRFGNHFDPFGNRFRGYLNGNGWNQLRVRANCGTQVVVVPGSDTTTVVQAPPAPVVTAPPVPAAAPAATPEAAPAPLTDSGHYHYPSAAPDTGDGSLAGK